MSYKFDSSTPLYLQIATAIEEDIFLGIFKEDEQIPSSNQFSATYHLNPATVLKGYNLLVDDYLIEKRRGMGMFVKHGAKAKIRAKRSKEFVSNYISPLLKEARKLGLSKDEIIAMINGEENETKC